MESETSLEKLTAVVTFDKEGGVWEKEVRQLGGDHGLGSENI